MHLVILACLHETKMYLWAFLLIAGEPFFKLRIEN